ALNSSVKRLLVIDPPILNRHYQVSTESGAYQATLRERIEKRSPSTAQH
ncbi:hypothetical protein FHW85_003942, partial [Dyella sp. SG609]|nr:hypothetical protein [Dyella sp. SG609]